MVKQAQARGMKLSAWVLERLDESPDSMPDNPERATVTVTPATGLLLCRQLVIQWQSFTQHGGGAMRFIFKAAIISLVVAALCMFLLLSEVSMGLFRVLCVSNWDQSGRLCSVSSIIVFRFWNSGG